MKNKKIFKQPIRKRPYLLFEIIVSLALVVLCLFPLLKPHIAMGTMQKKYLAKMERERLAQEGFCLVKVKLFENKEHTWEQLVSGTSGKIEHSLIDSKGKTYECTYTLKKFDSCTKNTLKKTGLLVEALLHLSSGSKTTDFQKLFYLERREA